MASDDLTDLHDKESNVTFHQLKDMEIFLAVRGMDLMVVANALIRNAAAIGLDVTIKGVNDGSS